MENKDDLLKRYRAGECTPEELIRLESWFHQLNQEEKVSLSDAEFLELKNEMWATIEEKAPAQKAIGFPFRRLVAAASILLVLGTSIYFYKHNKPTAKQLVAKEDFKPGSNQAVLTLAGGKQIILTGAANGQLAVQAHTIIQKTADGQVSYKAGNADSQPVYNTMTTPLGGQYHLVLADGTGVWLNAASSICFPTAFSGHDRTVSLTGEAYFEVAHNAAKPFRVISQGQTVEVLGTHFNINAYSDEGATRTTLLEGSVAVAADGHRSMIRPGQQATLNKNQIAIADVDVTGAVAWKDGYFQFMDTDIATMMRQIARWYNVQVVFDGPVTKETFTGRISRFRNISQVLQIVQASKSVHLSFEGRRIMVKQ